MQAHQADYRANLRSKNLEMAGLPKFLYSEQSQSGAPLITPVTPEKMDMRPMGDEAASNRLEDEFGDGEARNGLVLLGQSSRTTLTKYTVNSGKSFGCVLRIQRPLIDRATPPPHRAPNTCDAQS